MANSRYTLLDYAPQTAELGYPSDLSERVRDFLTSLPIKIELDATEPTAGIAMETLLMAALKAQVHPMDYRKWAPCDRPFNDYWVIATEHFREANSYPEDDPFAETDREISLGQTELAVTRFALALAENDLAALEQAA